MKKFAIAIINEFFSSLQIPGGAATSAILESIFQKKTNEAREILLEELADGKHPAASEDDLVYILYRYIRAAQEGAAKQNLRLLASVISGKTNDYSLTASKFLFYADIISALRPQEIELLGIMAKHDCNASFDLEEALIDSLGREYEEIFQSLLRTGLVIMEQHTSVRDQDDWKQGNKYISELSTTYRLTKLWEDIKTLSF